MANHTTFQTTLPQFFKFHHPNRTCRLRGVKQRRLYGKAMHARVVGLVSIHLAQIWPAHPTELFLVVGRNRSGVYLNSSGRWKTASLNVKSWSVVAIHTYLHSEIILCETMKLWVGEGLGKVHAIHKLALMLPNTTAVCHLVLVRFTITPYCFRMQLYNRWSETDTCMLI